MQAEPHATISRLPPIAGTKPGRQRTASTAHGPNRAAAISRPSIRIDRPGRARTLDDAHTAARHGPARHRRRGASTLMVR